MPDSHVEERICAPKSSLPSLPKLCTSKSTNYQKKEFGEDTSTVWHFESQTRGWSQLPKKNCIRLDNHFSSGTKYSNFSYQGRCSHLWVVYITNGDYHDSTACSKFDIHLAGHSFIVDFTTMTAYNSSMRIRIRRRVSKASDCVLNIYHLDDYKVCTPSREEFDALDSHSDRPCAHMQTMNEGKSLSIMHHWRPL